MFARVSSYKALFVSGDPSSGLTIGTGLKWLAEESPLSAPALLLVPQKDQLRSGVFLDLVGAPIAKLLANGETIPLGKRRVMAETNRTLQRSSWDGGPVLALWTDDNALDVLHTRPGVTAVCAIEWSAGNIQRWKQTMMPTDLMTGLAFAPPAQTLDRVVESALRAITSAVNVSTGLLHPSDRETAASAFQILHRAGYALPKDEIRAWAIRNGWAPKDAGEVATLASRIAGGARVSVRGTHWRADILERWRSEANAGT